MPQQAPPAADGSETRAEASGLPQPPEPTVGLPPVVYEQPDGGLLPPPLLPPAERQPVNAVLALLILLSVGLVLGGVLTFHVTSQRSLPARRTAIPRRSTVRMPAPPKTAPRVGTDVAFWQLRVETGRWSVRSASVDGQGEEDLTQAMGLQGVPSYSPSGDRFVVHAAREGNWDIYSMRQDGSEPERLTTDPGIDSEPMWSPKGDRSSSIRGATATRRFT